MTKLGLNKSLNKTVKFYEDNHLYQLFDEAGNYEKDLVSVTTLLNKFFPKFEKEKIAYFVAKKQGKTKEAIIKEWETTAKIATDFGTKVHLFGEMYITNQKSKLPIANNEKEEKYFSTVKDYIEKIFSEGWELVDVEKIIFDNYIGGMIDLLLVNHKKKLYVVSDWKTNKKIDLTSYSGNEYGFYPIESLENCSYNKYMLQMGFYTRLLILGEFLEYDYKINNIVLHITEKNVIDFIPKIDYSYYTKLMEQNYFNVRIR